MQGDADSAPGGRLYGPGGGIPAPADRYDGPVNLARKLLLVLGLAAVLGSAWLAPLDSSASQHAQAGLKRALASFAAARALNAVISVVQGTEIAVQPVGVGVTFTPGQALDPLNDLVEQFSLLMLAASVAFGVEIALIRFGGYWAVSLALTALAVAWGWAYWRGTPVPSWLARLFVAVLFVRFAVPLVVLGSEAGFRLFLQDDYAAGQSSIEMATGQLDRLAAPVLAPSGEEGLADRLKRWWSQDIDIGKRLGQLQDVASRAVDHVVKLIVVFLLQTLVVPLLLFWTLLRIGRGLAGISARGP